MARRAATDMNDGTPINQAASGVAEQKGRGLGAQPQLSVNRKLEWVYGTLVVYGIRARGARDRSASVAMPVQRGRDQRAARCADGQDPVRRCIVRPLVGTYGLFVIWLVDLVEHAA